MNPEQVIIPIEDSNDFILDIFDIPHIPLSPVAHTRRECPGAPLKERLDYFYDQDFDKEIDHFYRKAEATNAIKIDDGYFPLGARFLAGRKYYKTYSNGNIVRMKALLVLIKHSVGWLRTNVEMVENENDEHEWDIEFVSE